MSVCGLELWYDLVNGRATFSQLFDLPDRVGERSGKGLRDEFVLPFTHIGTRRVFASPCSRKPGEAWVQQQADAFVRHLAKAGHTPADALLFRDRDGVASRLTDGRT